MQEEISQNSHICQAAGFFRPLQGIMKTTWFVVYCIYLPEWRISSNSMKQTNARERNKEVFSWLS
ncbi:hypothetical protein J31TS4_39930 [Paenibacillus sp. J31TS4]|nr:hypothetical protein J31TS4_39930 [Paenibacillus sp. J31TS4]